MKKYQKQIVQWQKDEKEFLRVRSLLEDEIIKRTTVDYVPEKIIRQQENVLLRQYQTNSMSSRNIIDSWLERDKTIDKKLPFNEKIKKLAKQTVILSLALEKIMEDNKIELTDADRKKYYEKFAFSRGISMDDAKKQLSGDSNEALMVHEKIFKTLVDMNKNNKAK